MNKQQSTDRTAVPATYVADAPEFANALVEKALNAVLEREMTQLLGVALGYRSGHHSRKLTMKVGVSMQKVSKIAVLEAS